MVVAPATVVVRPSFGTAAPPRDTTYAPADPAVPIITLAAATATIMRFIAISCCYVPGRASTSSFASRYIPCLSVCVLSGRLQNTQITIGRSHNDVAPTLLRRIALDVYDL